MNLTPNESRIQETFHSNERDTKKIHRVITDVGSLAGMTWDEVFDFIRFGVEEELSELWDSYDWIKFQNSILKKLKKKPETYSDPKDVLSKPIPEFLEFED